MRVLFVCLGNICRSPTAEGVMRRLVADAGLVVEVESAGTGSWHVGEPPDARARDAAGRRGVVLEGTARQVTARDFERFDYVLAMDRENLGALRRLQRSSRTPSHAYVGLLREFDPEARGRGDLDVPDPYYGGAEGYEEVLDLVEPACRGLLEEIRGRVA
jgi:protein-tyrosine phosphatase